jgi:hypothetical protein
MGAINYKTSNYITIGLVPYDIDDLKNDKSFMAEAAEEVAEYGGVLDDNYLYDYISDCYECDYDNIKYALEKHDFCYYHVVIEPGYYEGFTLDIENNYGIAYNDWTQKAEAQKEITEIKQFLIDCAGMGLVSCAPGWGTSYKDYAGTIADINRAIKEMREEVKHTPTWRQYLIDCGEWKQEA